MDVIKGTVSIPSGYFNRIVKQEYSRWGRALIREFLQNSIDAGASEVKFRFKEDNLTLTITDDGCGMNKDTIINKLLVLGGTKKRIGSVGGFGKAKEILFFSWRNYSIKTQNYLVEGSEADFSIREIDTYHFGTKCIIQFNTMSEYKYAMSSATNYLPENEVEADIYLNTIKVKCSHSNKEKLKDLGWGILYKSNRSKFDILIRKNGINMYNLHSSSIKGLIIELTEESIDVLKANRDSLVFEKEQELIKVIRNLDTNKAIVLYNLEEDVQEVIEGKKGVFYNPLCNKVSLEINNSIVKPLVKSKFILDVNNDFIIRKTKSFSYEKINVFLTQNKKVAEAVANEWAKLISNIIVANNIKVPFIRPGFYFSENINGLCEGEITCPSILINPLSNDLQEEIKKGGVFLLKAYIEDIAYHELSHISNRSHNESFVFSLEGLRRNHRQWKKRNFVSVVL